MSAQTKTRRKKAQTATVEVIEPDTGVSTIPPPASLPMRVSMADLWEMRLAQADQRTAEAKADAARFQRLYALSKLDPKGIVLGIEKKLEDSRKALESAENRALIAKKRMEHTLGRSLAGLAIDPDSGEVQQG